MNKLAEEFDCGSLEEAKQLLEELQQESQETRMKLTREYQALVGEVGEKGLL
jgi:hypothetical protein